MSNRFNLAGPSGGDPSRAPGAGLFMFDPSRPPPPFPGPPPGFDQAASALSAQFVANYIAQLATMTSAVPPPLPGFFSQPPPPIFRPPSVPFQNHGTLPPSWTSTQTPTTTPNVRAVSQARGRSSSPATTAPKPRSDSQIQDAKWSHPNKDQRRSSSTFNRGQRPKADRSPSPSFRRPEHRKRCGSDLTTNRKGKADGADKESKIPASYRREKPASSISGRRDSSDDELDRSGDDSLSEPENEWIENEERQGMSNLDFEGVGSDVSDTEEEDNQLGTTEGDSTKWTQSAPARLYFQRDKQNPAVFHATEKLRALQDQFETNVVQVSRNARLAQPQLRPPSAKPFVHKCCHHRRSDSDGSSDSDSSRASSSSESEEGEISSNSGDSTRKERPKRNSKKEKRKGHHKTCGKERRRRRGSGSSHGSHCSSGSDSDVEHERFKMAIEEMTRKQEHPARLHPELWFNELGQMNDGPLCRCTWKAKQTGIAHSIYPGEQEIEACDKFSNNAHRLHHYRVVITPLENIKTRMATTIKHDDHAYQFDGFSLLSHAPLPSNLPVCRVIRWNIEYSVTFSKEEAPEFFTIRDLDLFWEYLFVELLELYDLRLRPSSSGCPIFHILPRFVRPIEDGGQEILPTSYVLSHFLANYRQLINDNAINDLARWPKEKWDKLVEKTKDQLVTNPNKRPSALRVDCLDRMTDENDVAQTADNYPVIVHFGVRPAVLTYTGNPEYQKAWKQYIKYRHLLMMKSKLASEDRARLAQKELYLQQLKAKASLKRDVTVEISSRGFYTTGIYTDVVQHSLMLLVAFCHVRFHWSLHCFENSRIKYTFRNRALLELAFTHPSYRQNYGTNPDHARNTLSNCGIRQPEYGNKRMQQILNRKRGINTLIDIMSRMGSKKVKQSQVTNNERLEYLGDAVIEFLSTIHLFFMFPDLQEGGLATYRASLVQNKHLAILAKKLGMDDFMLYAHGPDLCHEADLKHAMANAFEAVMGALFLDGGVDIADRVFGEALFRKEDDDKLHWVWFNLPKHPLQQQEPEGDRHWIKQVAVLQDLTEFENRTGIFFKHIRLLARAFTRKNVGYNFLTLGHNQRLEFLGDTVLQLITSEYLYKHFPEHHEGHLSLLRSCLVNNKTQSVICDDLGMTRYVVHPPAFLKTGLPELRMKDKADLVEAFLGALYVDRGLQFCKVFCKVCFYPRLKYFIMSQKWNDPKSQLQQCCLTLRNPDGGEPDIPTYKVISIEGPTNTRLYRVAVYFKGKRLATGVGHSVQEAEMKAAEEALKSRADLFPHLAKQRYFIQSRFGNELGSSGGRRKRMVSNSYKSQEDLKRSKRL